MSHSAGPRSSKTDGLNKCVTPKYDSGADRGPPRGGRDEAELCRVFRVLRATSKERRPSPSEAEAILSACAPALRSRPWPRGPNGGEPAPSHIVTWPEAGVHVIRMGTSLALVALDGRALRLVLESKDFPVCWARLSPDRRWLVVSCLGSAYTLSGYDAKLVHRWTRSCWENLDWKDFEVSNDRVLLAFGGTEWGPEEFFGEFDIETGDDVDC